MSGRFGLEWVADFVGICSKIIENYLDAKKAANA